MRIGNTLLLSFLLLVILPIAAVTSLAYFSAGDALRNGILHRLEQNTTTLMRRIDQQLFERIENLRAWRTLDVMQDASVGDVDKRLARFLDSVKKSYGEIYHEVLFRASSGQIVASSDSRHIGHYTRLDDGKTLIIGKGDDMLELLPVQRCHPTTRRRCLPIRTSINNRFTNEPMGWLVALLDWRWIENELTSIAETDLPEKHRLYAFLTDRHGKVIGSSANASMLRRYNDTLLLSASTREKTVMLTTGPGRSERFLTAWHRAPGLKYFPLTHWRVIVMEAEQEALAPVENLARLLLVVAIATTIVAIFVALWLGNHIARPIVRLADFSNHYDDRTPPPPPPHEGVTEVRELHQSLIEMIRRLKKSRRQLIQASKLAAVGEMAATLAHEVRTPLGILSSSAQLLQADPNLSDESREMTEFIVSETARLDRLITLLLGSGRPRDPHRRPMQLLEPLEHSLSLLAPKAQKRGVTIEKRLPERLPRIHGDAEQLQQVFLNLVLNAIQAMPDGGTIRIQARAAGNRVIVEIADSGPGIPESDRRRIFEPFVTGRESGFGLGLSIVQQIVEQHDAHIAVTDGPLGGALFTLLFTMRHAEKIGPNPTKRYH